MNENEIMENIEETILDDNGLVGLPDNAVFSNDVSASVDNGGASSGIDVDTELSDGITYDGSNMDSVIDNPIDSLDSSSDMEIQRQTEILVSYDYTEVLQSIDAKLSLIIFLMLVFWCIKHIRSAVRNATGRGIEL